MEPDSLARLDRREQLETLVIRERLGQPEQLAETVQLEQRVLLVTLVIRERLDWLVIRDSQGQEELLEPLGWLARKVSRETPELTDRTALWALRGRKVRTEQMESPVDLEELEQLVSLDWWVGLVLQGDKDYLEIQEEQVQLAQLELRDLPEIPDLLAEREVQEQEVTPEEREQPVSAVLKVPKDSLVLKVPMVP